MNRRIRELAELADIKLTPCIIDGEEYDFDNVEMDTSDELEEFARGIIRMCGTFTDPVTRNLMMNYFGVEE